MGDSFGCSIFQITGIHVACLNMTLLIYYIIVIGGGYFAIPLARRPIQDRIYYLSKVKNADGSTSGITTFDSYSAKSPWNIARNTELPMDKTYLCAGMHIDAPIKNKKIYISILITVWCRIYVFRESTADCIKILVPHWDY